MPPYARLLMVSLLLGCCPTASFAERNADRNAFDHAAAGDWHEAFHASGTGDWRERWLLDSEVGTVRNTPQGMELTTGPEAGNDAHHMGLWTRATFEGDIRIEYEITRHDSSKDGVNILYLQATASGTEPYHADIATWSELRRVPAIRHSFSLRTP